MAGKGGGSWKVAYADFVTAMMAFFLVMWIGAQDVKVRQSVANYFVDPSGVSKTAKAGGVMETPSPGQVPDQSKVSNSQGVRAPGGDVPSPSTAAVINWIRADPKRQRYWKDQSRRCREAAVAEAAANQSKTSDEVAAEKLMQLLNAEIAGGIPKETPDVYKDLIFGSFKEVNWRQVADDVIGS